MFEEIDAGARTLADRKAGWVSRRDAAELLSAVAARAVAALKSHEREPDVDVRSTVAKALAGVSAALAGIKPEAAEEKYTIEQLAQSCEKPGKRKVTAHGNGYAVEVILKDERRQTVFITPQKRDDGIELVRIHTVCGKPEAETLAWALRMNMQLAQCAFGLVTDEAGEETLVLASSYLEGHATPKEVRVAVKEVAFYGDWVENKLTGTDHR